MGVILTAGFEIFNDQITGKYVFEDAGNEELSKHPLEERTEKVSFRPSLPPIDTGLKAKYTFDNFVQEMEISGLKQQPWLFLKI